MSVIYVYDKLYVELYYSGVNKTNQTRSNLYGQNYSNQIKTGIHKVNITGNNKNGLRKI